MGSRLIVETLPACAPDRFLRLEAGLLQRMEAAEARPTLLVAPLQGEAVVLGRHQRAHSALELDALGDRTVLRRPGGGRTLRLGEGVLGVALALPALDTLLDAPVGADRFLNRHVRGLLAGLRAVSGRPVAYFGRDFLSADSRQVAVVSQDGLASGPALFEAFVSIDGDLFPPADLDGYPEHGDPRARGPEPATLASLAGKKLDPGALAAAIADGYARAHGCTVEEGKGGLEELAIEPPPTEVEEGWEESGVADVAIGFAEAQVRTEGDHVGAVRLRGDFIAPAFALRDLEQALVGTELDFAAIGTKVDEAFARPGAAILGLRSMRVLADAILAAAGRL